MDCLIGLILPSFLPLTISKPFVLGCPWFRLETGSGKKIYIQGINWDILTSVSLTEQRR